jgi:HSP90 family molecular chaperone
VFNQLNVSFTGKKPGLRISAKQPGRTITIRDAGIGIDSHEPEPLIVPKKPKGSAHEI